MVVLGIVTLTFIRKPVWIARRALLVLQAVPLACFLAFGIGFGPFPDPNIGMAVFVGILGVAAIAIQNGLVRLALPGAPSTAVMTTNVAQLTVDLATLVRGHDEQNQPSRVRRRADLTAVPVIGFAIGLALGAVFEIHFGLWFLIFPAILAALSIPLGEAWTASSDRLNDTVAMQIATNQSLIDVICVMLFSLRPTSSMV